MFQSHRNWRISIATAILFPGLFALAVAAPARGDKVAGNHQESLDALVTELEAFGAESDNGVTSLRFGSSESDRHAQLMASAMSVGQTVTVDHSGGGDYTTLKAAVDFVVTQGPTAGDAWGILVYPGMNLITEPIDIPQGVAVTGVTPFSSNLNQQSAVMLGVTVVPDGDVITLGGTLANLTILTTTTAPLSPSRLVMVDSITASMFNVTVKMFYGSPGVSPHPEMILVESPSGQSFYAYQSIFETTSPYHVVARSSGGILSLGWSFLVGEGKAAVQATGDEDDVNLYHVRIGDGVEATGFTTDLENLGTGFLNVLETPHLTTTGPINYWDRAPGWMELTIEDSGDAAQATATLDPRGNACRLVCLDADGCVLDFQEQFARPFQGVKLIVTGANSITLSEQSGILNLSSTSFQLDPGSVISVVYDGNEWLQDGPVTAN